jgi:hypothetical protein
MRIEPVAGYVSSMDQIHPAPTTEHREMQTIGRSLEDLSPSDRPQERAVWGPVLWSAAGLVVVIAFVGWLLVGSPPHQMAAEQRSAVYSAQPSGK